MNIAHLQTNHPSLNVFRSKLSHLNCFKVNKHCKLYHTSCHIRKNDFLSKIKSHGSSPAFISHHSVSPSKSRSPSHHSYDDIDFDSNQVARHLSIDSNRFMPLESAPIAFLTPNNYDYVRSILGIWKSGGVAVPLCNSHPPAEWEYYIKDSGAKVILTTEQFSKQLLSISHQPDTKIVILDEIATNQNKINKRHVEIDQTIEDFAVNLDPKRNALFAYTSGTTGKPKGVVLTHQNLIASMDAMIESWEWSPQDKILHVLPLHHIHGVVNALLTPLKVGATVEMIPKFDVATVIQLMLENLHIDAKSDKLDHSKSRLLSVFFAVPSIYVAIIKEIEAIEDPKIRENVSKAFQRLRLMVSGSAALPEPIFHKWHQISGHRLLERYGMTEIGMALTNPYSNGAIRRPSWVGKPFPGVQVKIAEESSNTASGDKSIIGELLVKSPQVFKEYWNRPEATKSSFNEEGWFLTGDSAEMDLQTGEYRILGRKSVDILKTGGFKVSALDIEKVLLDHPQIHEVAVVGIEDLQWGQVIGAIVALKPSRPGTEKVHFDLHSLQEWAKPHLASYKLPRRLLIIDSIPRNAMGKINKKELVKLFEQQSNANHK